MNKLNASTTHGEKYGPAMEITDQAAADAYFEECVKHTLSHHKPPITRQQAESIERQNLGYFAGYYSSETRERVERLFKCAHPFFGPIAVNGPPAPETAFNIGAALGQAMSGPAKAVNVFSRQTAIFGSDCLAHVVMQINLQILQAIVAEPRGLKEHDLQLVRATLAFRQDIDRIFSGKGNAAATVAAADKVARE